MIRKRLFATPEKLTEIDGLTGYAKGDLFTSADQVREYFTPESQIVMFDEDAVTDADLLADWADLVIEARSHMES